MSSVSSNLSLPYIQANQAQKHVTHNEGMRILDMVVQLSVADMDRTTPPNSPNSDQRHIVAAGATGDWAGQDGMIALWDNGGWMFITSAAGWVVWHHADQTQIVYDGTSWMPVQGPLQNLDLVGVNTSADATNRLAVASDATLLTHDGAGHQIKVNQNADSDTASLLFQTNWSGRAEMGTTGSDDFEIKVSPDGVTFHTALQIDKINGSVTSPNTTFGGPEFGDGALLTVDYISAKGTDLVANGSGLLGNTYNRAMTESGVCGV